jgi:hypothetical protein
MRLFLEQLFRDGRVTVPATATPWEFDADAERWVLEFDRSARLSLPGVAPELDFAAAAWAAERLAETVRLAITRDAGLEEIARAFATPCPAARSPSVDYSVDLFFRYLPDVFAWVRRLAANDPLVAALEKLAAEWPLSSVGIVGIAAASIDAFIGHAGLRRLYADRIIARNDSARLVDQRAADALKAALGDHAELAPACAEAAGIGGEK